MFFDGVHWSTTNSFRELPGKLKRADIRRWSFQELCFKPMIIHFDKQMRVLLKRSQDLDAFGSCLAERWPYKSSSSVSLKTIDIKRPYVVFIILLQCVRQKAIGICNFGLLCFSCENRNLLPSRINCVVRSEFVLHSTRVPQAARLHPHVQRFHARGRIAILLRFPSSSSQRQSEIDIIDMYEAPISYWIVKKYSYSDHSTLTSYVIKAS